MIKEFIYKSKDKVSSRRVLVLKEDDNYLEGLDLNLLKPEESKLIEEMYSSVIPVGRKDSIVLPNYDLNWNRFYRLFKKSAIEV